MKKLISTLLIVSLLVGALFVLTGCSNKDTGEKVPAEDNRESFEILDEFTGVKATVKYPKDQGYVLSDGETGQYPVKKLENEGKGYTIKITFEEESESSFEKYKKDCREDEHYVVKDVEFNSMPAFVAVSDRGLSGMDVRIKGTSENEKGKFYFVVVNIKAKERKDATGYYEIYDTEEVQNILKSITVEKTEAKKVEGTLSNDHKLLVKPITDFDSSKYELTQRPSDDGKGLGIVCSLKMKDHKYHDSGVNVQIRRVTDLYENLEKCKNSKYEYKDAEVAGKKVLENNRENPMPEKYQVYKFGIYEENNQRYEYDYYITEDANLEECNAFVNTVFNSIEVYGNDK